MHPVNGSISVKVWGIKEDIGISKRTTSRFRISYRSRDICLDFGFFNTVFHSLHYSQDLCFLQFYLISVWPLQLLHQFLKSSNRPGNRFRIPLGNYHHISFIRAIKSSVLTLKLKTQKKQDFLFRLLGICCYRHRGNYHQFLILIHSNYVSEPEPVDLITKRVT